MLCKLLVLLALTISPAYADSYLVFQPGQTVSNEIWNGTEPQAEQLPPGCKVKRWVPENDSSGRPDADLSHYVDTGANGVRRSIPPVPPPPEKPPQPDVVALGEAIWEDKALIAVRLQLCGFQALIAGELPKGAAGIKRIKEGWVQFKTDLPAEISDRVEELAARFFVPII